MKYILLLLSMCTIFFFGCSNDSGNPTGVGGVGGTGGDTGGGNNTGNVNIEVGVAQDNQGNILFGFNPGAAITIATIVVSQADQGINETINNPDPTQQFEPVQAGNYYSFYQPQQQLQTGQQWSFKFTGTIVQGGANYTKTINYTVQ